MKTLRNCVLLGIVLAACSGSDDLANPAVAWHAQGDQHLPAESGGATECDKSTYHESLIALTSIRAQRNSGTGTLCT
jgi:hypothetical protein